MEDDKGRQDLGKADTPSNTNAYCGETMGRQDLGKADTPSNTGTHVGRQWETIADKGETREGRHTTRSCLPWSPIVPHSLPLSPRMCACVGWCVRLPEVLSPIVSHCLPKWRVRLPDVLFPNCLPLSPHVCLCWMLCTPSRGLVSPCLPSCLSLSLVVSNCLATCACVGWSTFPESCSSLSPIVSLDMCACVGWCVRLPEVLSPLFSPHVTCVPVLDGASALDGVSAFPRSCVPLSACVGWCVRLPEVLFPLSPISLLVSLCWMVCPPSLVSPCLPVLGGVSASPRSCLHLSSIFLLSP